MNRTKNMIWGIALVVVGVIFALNELGLTDINIFFKGWWTLFIIIPSIVMLITSKKKTDGLFGLLVGVSLLLACQGVVGFRHIWRLILPALIVVIGIDLIFKDASWRKEKKDRDEFREMSSGLKEYCATFSGVNLNYDNEVFEGVELTAVFGGIKCDLRNAILNDDVVIKTCCIFGGVDIKVPENVSVKISSSSLFGGTSNKRTKNRIENERTIYINASNLFGGTEIK